MITVERLKQLLNYDPTTGIFRWIKTKRIAGGVCKDHWIITLNKTRYQAHDLAWLYCNGTWPPSRLDHKNRDSLNNQITNLRPATKQQNAANSKLSARNTSGYKGVYWSKKMNCWWAAITVNGKQKSLGCFENPDEAFEAYKIAATKAFGEFANPARA